MTISTPNNPHENESISDSFKDGKLQRRSITKGNLIFSMDYMPEAGSFYGSVIKQNGKEFEHIYTITEYASDQRVEFPYPELTEIRDMLAKIWAEDIQKWCAKNRAINVGTMPI